MRRAVQKARGMSIQFLNFRFQFTTVSTSYKTVFLHKVQQALFKNIYYKKFLEYDRFEIFTKRHLSGGIVSKLNKSRISAFSVARHKVWIF